MKDFFRTLYGKISSIFLVLIIIVGAIEIFVSVRSSVNYVCEASQKLNYNLARDLSKKIQPLVQNGIKHDLLSEYLSDLMVLNPKVDIYLLDSNGILLSSFVKVSEVQRQDVDKEPILEFLASDSYTELPIFGDDPLSDTRRKVFSAAPIEIGQSGPGYLYIILASARYDLASEGIKDSYILTTSIVVLMTILLFGTVVGLIFFFYVTKRLKNVTETVKAFEKGNHDLRVNVTSDDELSELAQSFNSMADTLQKNMLELKKNDTLRRELVANISHDLRSPLASIQGYVETILLKDEQLNNKERKNFLETIFKNVSNLSHLVHELFELSKLDSKQNEPQLEAFSIADLAHDVVLKFQPMAEHRNIHLITKIPVSLPLVCGDIAMIERVLSNLIDNALNFSDDNSKITVHLICEGEDITVKVSDTGSGIPKEDLPLIFNRFYRVEKSRSKKSGGSGLGLAIAKKIIEAHDRQLNVESEVGVGTSFSFNLEIYTFRKEKPVAV